MRAITRVMVELVIWLLIFAGCVGVYVEFNKEKQVIRPQFEQPSDLEQESKRNAVGTNKLQGSR